MKRFLSLVLALIMLLSLCGCGEKNENTYADPKQTDTVETEEPEVPEKPDYVPLISDYGGVSGVFSSLNSIEDPEEFENTYRELTDAIESQGFSDEWDSLCRGASAYWDYLSEYELIAAYEKDWVMYYGGAPQQYEGYISVTGKIAAYGFSDMLREKIYTPGNQIFAPAILWTNKTYGYTTVQQTVEPEITDPIAELYSYDWVELCGNELFCNAFFEHTIDDDVLAEITELGYEKGSPEAAEYIVSKYFLQPYFDTTEIDEETALFLLEIISERTETAYEDVIDYPSVYEKPSEKPRVQKKNGESITVMLIETGEEIGIDKTGIESIYDYPEKTCRRDMKFLEGIFGDDVNEKVTFTSIESEADVILLINTRYVNCGQYSSGAHRATVFGTEVWFDAILCGTGEREYIDSEYVYAENMPGNSVSTSGGSVVWMYLPEIDAETDSNVADFRDAIYAWFE